ncbi:hypothetical protein [Desulfomonile tiedjei]|uniref:Uncharacterized protein n=1 Tax=Desulfomonile tiedjei (strain ATCC 49306 / DSM 6799 / DCB-1) TaxID=706587 RepID=I4C6Y0_DESTA|nr:hypothetical protein [Desulfomonile tiedjei]AFM25321.1 hypothetical protein Desti_2642 [Desulfomonile tiedjei DSM 6799]
MKCQSDYGPPEDVLMQSDECIEPWWESEAEPPQSMVPEAPKSPAETIIEHEALRRGLVKVDENGEPCMSCPDQEENP